MGNEITTAYNAGYDSVIRGANTTNCGFRWFATPDSTTEWERGVREAKATDKGRSKTNAGTQDLSQATPGEAEE